MKTTAPSQSQTIRSLAIIMRTMTQSTAALRRSLDALEAAIGKASRRATRKAAR